MIPRPAVIHWISPGTDDAAVPHAVAVLDGPRQDVGDRLDPAMRMPREAGQVILRHVIAKVIQEEKRIEVGGIAEAEGAAQVDTGPFDGRLGFDETLDGADGHGGPRGWGSGQPFNAIGMDRPIYFRQNDFTRIAI